MTTTTAEKIKINVNHIARVEGHGSIRIGIENGRLTECSWDVVETPRFFEAMFRGLSVEMAPLLAARVCGICSISHALTAARAAENALGIEAPARAQKVRLLAKHAETLQSHVLHLFFLVAPDFLGVGSVVPLLQVRPDLVEIATALRRFANRASDLAAGRTSHPMAIQVGGLSQVPRKSQLAPLRNELDATLPYLWKAVEVFKSLPRIAFERETEFVSLHGNGRYPFIGGDLASSDGVRMPERAYREMTNEYMAAHSTSKLCRLSRESFAVGALARFNNNAASLHPAAQAVAEEIGLRPVSHNPFDQNLAQLVECVHVLHEARELITKLLDSEPGECRTAYDRRAGEGVGAVEAPRGILYHHFELDQAGKIVRANCVIPTGQNHANIRHDLEALVIEMASDGASEDAIRLRAQMLVRAYDPCISCSVH